MYYYVTKKNEDGELQKFGGYARTQAEALNNIAIFHGGGNIVEISFEI